MAKFSYEQISEAKVRASILRDAGVLAMFGERSERERHCDEMIEHLGQLATALGYLIEPINADAAGKPEACPHSEAEEGGASLPPSTHPGLGASS